MQNTSPSYNNKKDVDYNAKRAESSLSKEFQNFLNKDIFIDPELEILKSEDECLDQLIDELVHVFYFENIDNSTKTQKKDLI